MCVYMYVNMHISVEPIRQDGCCTLHRLSIYKACMHVDIVYIHTQLNVLGYGDCVQVTTLYSAKMIIGVLVNGKFQQLFVVRLHLE